MLPDFVSQWRHHQPGLILVGGGAVDPVALDVVAVVLGSAPFLMVKVVPSDILMPLPRPERNKPLMHQKNIRSLRKGL